jgi:hypothetical protein
MDRNDHTHPTGRHADGEPARDEGIDLPDLDGLAEGVVGLAALDPAEVAGPAVEIAEALSALLEAAEVDR